MVLAALLLGGFAVVVLQARARIAAVHEQADRVAETQSVAAEYFRDMWTQPQVMRILVTESMANDTMPSVSVQGEGANLSVSYGAFGGASSGQPLVRPWSLPLSTVPFGVAAILTITVTLVAASRWSPSPQRDRPIMSRRNRP